MDKTEKNAIRWMVWLERDSTPLFEIGRDIGKVLASKSRLYRANAIRFARQCHRENRGF